MATDKYKRKKQHGQRIAQQATKRGVVMEQKKTAEKNTEPAANRADKPTGDETPSRWSRFKNWVCESSSFTDWCVAFFTSILTFVAIYQFIITSRQLNVMRKDLRAWIQVTLKSDVAPAVNVAPSAVIVVNNTGKTPATGYTGRFYVDVFPNGPDPQFGTQPGVHIRMTGGAVFPNGPVEAPAVRVMPKGGGFPNEGEVLPLTEEEMAALNDGKSWIAVYGSVEYEDTFHTKHWTRFCFWKGLILGAPYSAKACTAYNSVDDNE
jgi:hypothetical protein